jgi:hypothetical protein
MKNRTFRTGARLAVRPRRRGAARVFVLGAAFAPSAAITTLAVERAAASQIDGGESGLGVGRRRCT